MRTILLMCCFLASLPAAAQVNKCMVDGKAVYQAAPCKAGTAKATLLSKRTTRTDRAVA